MFKPSQCDFKSALPLLQVNNHNSTWVHLRNNATSVDYNLNTTQGYIIFHNLNFNYDLICMMTNEIVLNHSSSYSLVYSYSI